VTLNFSPASVHRLGTPGALSASYPAPQPSGAGDRLPAPLRRLPVKVPPPAAFIPLPPEAATAPQLTDSLLFHYQRCGRRAFLDRYGNPSLKDAPSDYLQKLKQDSSDHRRAVLADYAPLCRPAYGREDWMAGAAATEALMAQGVEAIQGGVLVGWLPTEKVTLVSRPDLLIRQSGASRWGEWHYLPVDIKLGKKPKLDYQVVGVYHAQVLAQVQGRWPETCGLALRQGDYSIDLDRQRPRLEALLNQCLAALAQPTAPEVFIAHGRCDLCHWYSHCYQEATATNHLSLLPGVTAARYGYLMRSQLTSVSALATASPAQLAPLPGFGDTVAEKLIHQAQAVLHNQAIPRQSASQGYPLRPQDLPSAPVELYFDIEAAPDRDLIYLHGVLVVDRRQGRETFHALLAEDPSQEADAWYAFIDLVQQYPDAPIYHFCPYESQTAQRLAHLYEYPDPAALSALLSRFVDVHRHITEAVTLPVESYALKHIARWLGFDWRDAGANGAQSICWYDDWLTTCDRTALNAILRYNEDDCRATYWVKRWLHDFSQPHWAAADSSPNRE
jgi:predicted RecB family nuclease